MPESDDKTFVPRIGMVTKEQYERLWAIDQKANEIFRRDHPTGHLHVVLPQFRSSSPDPVMDHYRRLAVQEMVQTEQKVEQTGQQFHKGDRVIHEKFGAGTVVATTYDEKSSLVHWDNRTGVFMQTQVPNRSLSVEQQEQAATQYWQSLVQRDRAAKAADAQTQQQAQNASARDDQKLQQDTAQARKAQQGLAQG